MNYGEVVDNGLVGLLENFANTTDNPPFNPLEGQLWWDKTRQTIRIRDGFETWRDLAMADSSIDITVTGEGRGLILVDPNAVTNHRKYRLTTRLIGSPAYAWFVVEELDDATIPAVTATPLVISGDQNMVWVQPVTGATNPGVVLQNGSVTAQSFTVKGVTTSDITAYDGTVTATLFAGVATSARYADVAERFEADQVLEPGDVVELGGEKEIRKTTEHHSCDVLGVISTNPALRMNEDAGDDSTHPFVAFCGRVPCKVLDAISKGERIVSSRIPGVGRAFSAAHDDRQAIFGRALQSQTESGVHVIEIVVGVN